MNGRQTAHHTWKYARLAPVHLTALPASRYRDDWGVAFKINIDHLVDPASDRSEDRAARFVDCGAYVLTARDRIGSDLGQRALEDDWGVPPKIRQWAYPRSGARARVRRTSW